MPQCCYAANAYALLTYFRAERPCSGRAARLPLPFAAKAACVAAKLGDVRSMPGCKVKSRRARILQYGY
jgi:hypothetical protein